MADITRTYRIRDPRGLEVTLAPSRWNRHILVHHLEMASQLKNVLLTIEEPEVIQLSTYDPDVHLYFRRKAAGFGKFSRLYIEVVVRLDTESVSGHILTAHYTNALEKGRILWARKR